MCNKCFDIGCDKPILVKGMYDIDKPSLTKGLYDMDKKTTQDQDYLILTSIPVFPQSQAALHDQVMIAVGVLNKVGLYDASDFLMKSWTK